MKVIKVDYNANRVFFEDGSNIGYDKLYSSVPLPEMVNMLDGVPMDIAQMVQEFEHTSVVLVSLGLKAVAIRKFWFYIYDTDILAARAYMPSEKSIFNVPEGFSSIQFEFILVPNPCRLKRKRQ